VCPKGLDGLAYASGYVEGKALRGKKARLRVGATQRPGAPAKDAS
jgi:hypothetical protein